MLEVRSRRRLEEMEAAICRAAQRHGASILAVSHVGRVVREEGRFHDALTFTVCHPVLYETLLAAEPRFAALLPCRIAARSDGHGVTLETVAPRELCRLLDRTDLEGLAYPLESMLRGTMEDAALPARAAVASAQGGTWSGPGAVETQMSMHGTVAQRIDCRGTKVEDLAGTGQQDSPGG